MIFYFVLVGVKNAYSNSALLFIPIWAAASLNEHGPFIEIVKLMARIKYLKTVINLLFQTNDQFHIYQLSSKYLLKLLLILN